MIELLSTSELHANFSSLPLPTALDTLFRTSLLFIILQTLFATFDDGLQTRDCTNHGRQSADTGTRPGRQHERVTIPFHSSTRFDDGGDGTGA